MGADRGHSIPKTTLQVDRLSAWRGTCGFFVSYLLKPHREQAVRIPSPRTIVGARVGASEVWTGKWNRTSDPT
jgi:hypothetical protein